MLFEAGRRGAGEVGNTGSVRTLFLRLPQGIAVGSCGSFLTSVWSF